MTHGTDVLLAGVGIGHAAGAHQQALAVHHVHDLMDMSLDGGRIGALAGHDAVIDQMAVDNGLLNIYPFIFNILASAMVGPSCRSCQFRIGRGYLLRVSNMVFLPWMCSTLNQVWSL